MRRLIAIAALALVVLVAGGAAADTFAVRLISQTSNSITLGWDPQPGYGYLFFQDCTGDVCTLEGRTNNAATVRHTFQKGHNGYKISVITEGANGTYSTVTPPPPTDTTAPIVAMTAPTAGATLSGTITSSATASDSVGVTRVEFFHDGISYANDTTAPYSTTIDTTTLANGSHTFGARAYDAAGNIGLAPNRTATVSNVTPPPPDTTPPTVSVTAPVNGSTVSGTINETASASDNIGVTRVEFRRDGNLFATDTTSPYSASFNTTTIADGSHTFGALAYDAAGNIGAAADVTVIVSNVVPPPAQCADGIDNDGDGFIDMADIGCSNPTDNDETNPVPPPPGNVFISPTGNDVNACSAASPCRSLQRGYAAVASGNTINVANGSYDGATLTGSKTVTFTVASGTASITDTLMLESLSNVTFNGPFQVTLPAPQGWSMRIIECSGNLEFHNFSGHQFDITDSTHGLRMYGGNWGDYVQSPWGGDSAVGGSYGYPGWSGCGDGWVRDVLFDGVRWHDVQFDTSQWDGAHPDCLESHGAFTNITIRNSTFERCGNTFIGTYLDWGSFDGLLIENNLMIKTTNDTYYGVQLGYKPGYTCHDLVFRYNTYDPDAPGAAYPHAPPLIDDCADTGTAGHTQVYGNIFRQGDPGGCSQSWSYNVFEEGNACGTNAVVGQAGYVSRGSNYHLAAGAFALGKGDPGRFPGTDFEGTARSSPPDAGYDER